MTKNIIEAQDLLMKVLAPLLLQAGISQTKKKFLIDSFDFVVPSIYQKIFFQGEKIIHYYFLLKGSIMLTKIANPHQRSANKQKKQRKSLVVNDANKLSSPGIIGQYYYHENKIRIFTAVSQQQYCLIAKIPLQVYCQIFKQFVKDRIQIQSSAAKILEVPYYAVNPEQFIKRKYSFFEFICNPIYAIILSGQCKVLARRKKYKQPNENSSQKFRLPLLIKSRLQPMSEILIIGKNQWLGIENLYQNNLEFKYQVTSQSMEILIIPQELIFELPAFKNSLLQQVCASRAHRFETVKKFVPESYPQLEQSKKNRKRAMQAHQILHSLDPNISPKFLRQQYRLGYQNINYQLNVKKQRKSLRDQFSVKKERQITRTKKERVTDIKSCNRDLSNYIKIQFSSKGKGNLTLI